MKVGIFKMAELEYWELPEDVKEDLGEIYTYYIFNTEEVTHLASATPSIWAIPVHMEIENEVSDELHEEIYNVWASSTEPDYFTANVKYSEDGIDWDDLEEAVEYYQGNAPYISEEGLL